MPEVGKIWIKVTPDLREFWTKLKAELEKASDEEVHVRLVLDSQGFREKVKAETEGMKAEVKVKPKMDDSAFAKVLAETKAAAKAADMKLDVNFKDKEAESHLLSLIARLKAVARLSKIDLKVDTERRGEFSRGGGLLSGAAQGVGGVVSGIASGAGSLLSAMKDNTVMILVAGLVLAAPALALLSQALVGLPALISAVALPIGVFALGLGGLKKALDDSGILDLVMGKKGKDGKQGLGKGLKEIQSEVSDVFEKGFTPIFRQIGGVIPQLLRGLPFVAQGIVNLAQSVTKAVITPEFVANFDRFTNSVGTMLTRMGPGLGAFASGMMTLITNVGDHLPALGSWLGSLGTRFNTWVTAMSKPVHFWGKDIPDSSPLDKMIKNVKPTLDGIVDFVTKLVGAGAKLAQDPDMANKLKGALDGLATFITKTLPDLAAGFKTLATGMKDLGLIPDKPVVKKPGEPGGPPAVPPAQQEQRRAEGKDPQSGKFEPNMRGILGAMNHLADNVLGPIERFPSNLIKDLPGPVKRLPHNLLHGFDDLGPVGPAGKASADTTPFDPGKAVGAPKAPPPPVKAPKIEPLKLPPGSEKLWEPVIAATKAAGAAINGEVASWAGKIKAALDSAASTASASGAAIGQRFAAGIRASQGAAVAAAHDLADAVKAVLPHSPAKDGPFSGSGWTDVFNSGGAITDQLAAGLREGSDDPVGEAKSMAQRLADAVAAGRVSPDLLEQAKSDMQALGDLSSNLSDESSGLSAPAGKAGKAQRDHNKEIREGIKGQREQIKQAREQLKIEQERAQALAKTQPKEQKKLDMNEELGKQLQGMVTIGANFAQSNMKQFEQDLGIGGGAISSIGDQMLGWGSQALGGMLSGMIGGKGMKAPGGGDVHYHVQSVDEALQADRHNKARQSLQYAGR